MSSIEPVCSPCACRKPHTDRDGWGKGFRLLPSEDTRPVLTSLLSALHHLCWRRGNLYRVLPDVVVGTSLEGLCDPAWPDALVIKEFVTKHRERALRLAIAKERSEADGHVLEARAEVASENRPRRPRSSIGRRQFFLRIVWREKESC